MSQAETDDATELDRAYARFHERVPFRKPTGFDTHGPMLAEVLETFGHSDRIPAAADRHLESLDSSEAGEARPFGETWREGLGERETLPRWRATFRRALDEASVRSVLDTWVPRLAPGVFSGAYHAIIRLGHALRAWSRAETTIRRRELAEALAIWATRYRELPSRSGTSGGLRPWEVVEALEPLDEPLPGGSITSTVFDRIESHPRAAETLMAVRPVDDPEAFGADLVRTAARVYAGHTGHDFALLHGVTGSTAIRYLSEQVDERARIFLSVHGAHALTAVYVAAVTDRIDGGRGPSSFDRERLVDRALADGSAHALKLTDAIIRNRRRDPDPVYANLVGRYFD